MGHGVGDCLSNRLRQCLRCALRPGGRENVGANERCQPDHERSAEGQRTMTSIMSRDMLVQVVHAWLNWTTD